VKYLYRRFTKCSLIIFAVNKNNFARTFCDNPAATRTDFNIKTKSTKQIGDRVLKRGII